MIEIDRINDKLFKKIFGNPKNARDFLKKALPQKIKKRLDFTTIKIDPTNYVSNEFKEGYSDIVVKVKMQCKSGGKIPTDIYFILEHKTKSKVKVFIQILKYMCFVWEQDINDKKSLRPIIPIVFYHGKEKWKVPGSFVEQFDVEDEVKEFLLNFKYILFDTNSWDFRDESNKELKDNVFLFTAMAVMKAAFKNDTETIGEIFHFWHEKGFTQNKESALLFLAYISQTQEIDREQLKKMLDESKIDGGELMQTLAQQLKKEALNEEKIKTAKKMIERGFDIETIIDITELDREKIKELTATSH